MKKLLVLGCGLLAALDVLVVLLFFGPGLTGISLRFIPGWDGLLPSVAIQLLWATLVWLALVAGFHFRGDAPKAPASQRAALLVMAAYVLLVGGVLLSLHAGGV